MALKRPLGVTIWAGLFTIIGGFTSFILFLEIIDSLRLYGLGSLAINDPMAFAGFVLYGMTPILAYSTGVGLFMSRAWTRWVILTIIPGLMFLYSFNFACHLAKTQARLGHKSPLELISLQTDVFLNILIVYLIIILPLIFYFRSPVIKRYFGDIRIP